MDHGNLMPNNIREQDVSSYKWYFMCSTATAGAEGLSNAEVIGISSVVGGLLGTLIIVVVTIITSIGLPTISLVASKN